MKMLVPFFCLLLSLALLNSAPEASAGADTAAKPAPKAIALAGKVMETMDGGGYTYVLLKTADDKVWVAAPLMKVKVGQELSLKPGYEFKNFKSKGLNRKFDKVIFSAGLMNEATTLSPAALKMAHQGVPKEQAKTEAPSAKAQASSGPIKVGKVSKAKGANAYSVGELYAKRAKLEKKPIVVHGRVMKVVSRIMKKNWIHIQDGSGSASKKTNELVVTTADLPEEGDLVTVKGTLYNKVDFGSGYRYELLVQDGKVTK